LAAIDGARTVLIEGEAKPAAGDRPAASKPNGRH
jgi:hypothetical protein